MKQLLKSAKAIIAILVLTISLNGCDNSDDNLPDIFAGFTHTINPATGTVTFINTSTDVKYYSWDFGDETTSTEINPIKTYANGTYTVVLTIRNVAGASATYEDIITIGGSGGEVVCTAETVESLSAASLNVTFKTDQTANIVNDGANFQWVANPKSDSEVNASCKVGKVTKTATNPWDNNQISLDGKLDFNTHSGLKMKVFSSVPGYKVLLKLEDKANAGINTEVEVTTTKTNEWEEISFPFAATHSGKYDKIVLIFDLATANTNTYYFDDITFYGTGTGGGTGGDPCTTETAESMTAANLNVTFKTDQTANIIKDGADFSWVANPKSDTGINTSCKVGKVTNLAANPWDNVQINLDAKLDFTTHSGLKLKVYSLKAGTKITMKLEEIGAPGNNSGDVPVVRTKTGEWEELSFAFPASASGKFNKIVIFFDLESVNSDTYYFDDLTFYGTGSGGGNGGGGTAAGEIAVNGGFETGDFSGWAVYKNGGAIDAITTEPSSGTYSAKLFASAATGLNPTLKQERKAAGTLAVGDKVKITFDYKGALTGESGMYSIQSFVEAAEGVNQVVNITVNPTASWQTYTTTYTVAAGDISGGITLEFVAVCGGVPGCSSTLYIDNASIIINP